MTSPTKPEQVQFEDWLAICNVKADYCRMLDTKDWDGWTQLFTEDFVLDTADSGGFVITGRAEAVAAVRAAIETARTAHQVHFPRDDNHRRQCRSHLADGGPGCLG